MRLVRIYKKPVVVLGLALALNVAIASSAMANLPGGSGSRETSSCELAPRIIHNEPGICSHNVRGRAADTARLQAQADAYETQQANQVTADPVTTTSQPAGFDSLASVRESAPTSQPAGFDSLASVRESAPATQPAGFDQAPASSGSADIEPASSNGIDNEIGWWMVGIAVAAGAAAGLIVGLRRGSPHALS